MLRRPGFPRLPTALPASPFLGRRNAPLGNYRPAMPVQRTLQPSFTLVSEPERETPPEQLGQEKVVRILGLDLGQGLIQKFSFHSLFLLFTAHPGAGFGVSFAFALRLAFIVQFFALTDG